MFEIGHSEVETVLFIQLFWGLNFDPVSDQMLNPPKHSHNGFWQNRPPVQQAISKWRIYDLDRYSAQVLFSYYDVFFSPLEFQALISLFP